MDLLLFFIKRDEIDIYDIPISRIADEYLAYVRVLEDIDLDGVGDFLYMAALLISIKARMLIPSKEEGETEEEVDPRRELVERLLEYVRFKEAADQLETRREHRRNHFTRRDASARRERIEDSHEAEIDESVYDLVQALGAMLQVDESDPDPSHAIEPLEYSVDDQQSYVLNQLQGDEPVSFQSLVADRAKGFIIATFLAILELTRQHYLTLDLSDDRRDFLVRERPDQPLQPDDPALDVRQMTGGDGAAGDGAPPLQ